MFGKTFSVVVAIVIGASAFADSKPALIRVPLEKAFVPVGFDDNDVTQLVVAGQFPDTCHKLGPTNLRIDEATGTVWLEQTAYQYSEICLRMFVPFTQVVSLGILRAADYVLADATSQNKLGNLPVLRAKTAAADDYLYAPVTDADVVPGEAPGKQKLVVRGAFTDRCTTMKEIRVGYYDDVLVVQPIAKYLPEPERGCGFQKSRFEYTVNLTKALKGAYLIHVRVMNGQAINKIVDLP